MAQINYSVEWQSITKYKIDWSFDVAVPEVMATSMIIQCILFSPKLAIIECHLITWNLQRHSLSTGHTTIRSRCCVLIKLRRQYKYLQRNAKLNLLDMSTFSTMYRNVHTIYVKHQFTSSSLQRDRMFS